MPFSPGLQSAGLYPAKSNAGKKQREQGRARSGQTHVWSFSAAAQNKADLGLGVLLPHACARLCAHVYTTRGRLSVDQDEHWLSQ